jgi:predicted nucleotidyltransferase
MDLLKTIVDPFTQDSNTLSVVLIGSGSRDELDAYSDLDILVIVRGERPPDQMYHLENRLVNLYFLDTENRESMLSDPWRAILNIGATRGAKIFFDPDGWYTDLQARARAFSWESVQEKANQSISWVMAQNAEMVQKILSGLSNNNLEKTLYATNAVFKGLADVGALANGVLSNSENRFWSAVRDAEPDAAWKNGFWTALGFDGESITARAEATLGLYARSFELHESKLLPEHLKVVQHVCGLIAAHQAHSE